MRNPKGFALFEILIVIVIISCVGGFIYLSLTEKKEPETTPTPTTKVTATTVPSPTSVTTTLPYDPVDVVWEREFPMNECAGTNPVDSVNEGNIWLIFVSKFNPNPNETTYQTSIYLSNESKDPNSIKLISTNSSGINFDSIIQNCRYIAINEQTGDAGDVTIIKTDGILITDSVLSTNYPYLQNRNYSLAMTSFSISRNIIEVRFVNLMSGSTAQVDLTTGKIIPESLQVIQ